MLPAEVHVSFSLTASSARIVTLRVHLALGHKNKNISN